MKFKLSFFLVVYALLFFFCSCEAEKKLENGNFQTEIDGIKIDYTIKGEGPVMIVSHPSSGKIGYEMTLQPLEDLFTMVYYDPRGCGNSTAPDSIEGYKQAYFVAELEQFREKLGVDDVWLFGHSDQSAIALQYAVEYQENLSGMMLSGTSHIGTIQESNRRRSETEKKRIQESEWFEQVIKDWDYMIEHGTETDSLGRDLTFAPLRWWCYNEETSKKVIPISKATTKAGRRKPINNQIYPAVIPERQKYLDYQEKFQEIKTKILIINGKYDTNNQPKYAEELHELLEQSDLIMIENAGHFPWVEQPDETFGRIREWLD